MLPFAAFLLFALFGIAALNVDMGMAFGAKARLESATETLALERSRLNVISPGGVVDPEEEAAALDGLMGSLMELAPAETGSSPGPVTLRAVEGPVLGDDGEVALSRRIPLLFGRGAVPTRDDEPLDLDELRAANGGVIDGGGLRGRGLAPGARARVLSQPVLRVGLPQAAGPTGDPVPGLALVALDLAELPPQDPEAQAPVLFEAELTVDLASGDVQRGDPSSPVVVGRVIHHPSNPNDPCAGAGCSGWAVGDVPDFSEGLPLGLPAVSGPAYVPVYDSLRCNRVVGFVAAQVSLAGSTLLLTPLQSLVADNASAIPDASAMAPDPSGPLATCPLPVAEVRNLAVPILRVAALARHDAYAVEAP